MTHTIKLNATGTHALEIKEEYLQTIRQYGLFSHLVDSGGYINEEVLDKLKFNIRSLIATQANCKELLDLCIDIIYHNKMKAYGLSQLIELYKEWDQTHPEEEIQEAVVTEE